MSINIDDIHGTIIFLVLKHGNTKAQRKMAMGNVTRERRGMTNTKTKTKSGKGIHKKSKRSKFY